MRGRQEDLNGWQVNREILDLLKKDNTNDFSVIIVIYCDSRETARETA